MVGVIGVNPLLSGLNQVPIWYTPIDRSGIQKSR